MRKIIYNQFHVEDKELINSIYEFAIKNKSLEADVTEVLNFSSEFYKANLYFPSVKTIKEKFINFDFITEEFKNEKETAEYLKDTERKHRNLYKKDLTVNLLDENIPVEKRIGHLEELTRLEVNLFNNEDLITDVDKLDIKEIYENRKTKDNGYFTNIPEIDELTGGISAGKIFVVLAPPKSFKTTFAINTAYINLNKEGNNTLFISLEIPRDELYYKMLVRHSYNDKKDISTLKILKGTLNDGEEENLYQLDESFRKYKKSNLWIMESKDVKMNTLSELKQQLIDVIEKNKITTIFVDYIQLFTSVNRIKGYNKDFEMLNDIIGVFRYIGVTYNVRTIILSQMTKEGMKTAIRTEGNISQTDASDATALITASYYMISMFCNDKLKASRQIKIGLLLHRDGETYEPKMTFVIPEKFLIGNIDISYESLLSNESVKVEDNINMIDLFSED